MGSGREWAEPPASPAPSWPGHWLQQSCPEVGGRGRWGTTHSHALGQAQRPQPPARGPGEPCGTERETEARRSPACGRNPTPAWVSVSEACSPPVTPRGREEDKPRRKADAPKSGTGAFRGACSPRPLQHLLRPPIPPQRRALRRASPNLPG